MSRPNFLIVQADQLTAKVLNVGGSGIAKTPYIDELASSGAVFQNAYCNFPLCAPSRMAMLSGQLASRVDVFDNACALGSEVPTYAHYLRNLGYRTILSGKMHFVGPDQLHGFEERLTTDIYPSDFYWTENKQSRDPKHKSDARGVTRAGRCDSSVQLEYDNLAMLRAEQKLIDLSKTDDERPWLLHVSLTHPHDPYFCTDRHWLRYQDSEIPAPRVPRIAVADQDSLSRFINERHCLDDDFEAQQIATARHGYLGSVSYFDDQVGKLVDRLSQLKLDDNTIIVVTSDHGDMLGERGMWFKRHHFEWSSRVPLLIKAPGRLGHNVSTVPVSHVDLLPTLLALATDDQSTELAEPVDGHSLLAPDPKRPVLAETMSDGIEAPALMVRQGPLKLIAGPALQQMLFDLDSDPDEEDNIAKHSATSVSTLMDIIDHNWKPLQLQQKIDRSIHRRLLIRSSHGVGEAPVWDYDSDATDNDRWCRGGSDYNDWAFAVVNPR